MSLRTRLPGLGVQPLVPKPHSLTTWRSVQQKTSIRRILSLTPLVVHAVSETGDGSNVRNAQEAVPAPHPASVPDPWASSSSALSPLSSPAVAAVAASSGAPLPDSAASGAPSEVDPAPGGAHSPLPSPWDAAAGVTIATTAVTSQAAETSGDTTSGTTVIDENEPDSSIAASAAHTTISSTGGSSTSPASASTAAEASGSAATIGLSSGGGGGSSSSSAADRSEAAAAAAPFNLREASAELSEDTAALLSRLRAELARTSNIPMPPRRVSASSSSSSSPTTSANSSSSSTTTTGTSSSRLSGGEPVNAFPSAPPAASTTKPAEPPVPPAAPSPPRSPGPKPPTSAAMSEEALAAALAAAGLPAPEGLGAEGEGSGASRSGLRLPALPPALQDLLDGFLRKQRKSPSDGVSAAAAAADITLAAGGRINPASAPSSSPSSSSPSSSSSSSPFIPGTGTAKGSSLGGASSSSSSGASSSASGSSPSSGGGGGGRRRRALVVGGGIGGLVSAARLAKEGFSVTLLEANSQVGGRCQSLQRGRFRFDSGPSLLLFIETYRRAFAALGTSLAQQVPVVRVTPAAYRVFFQGEGSLDMLYDVQRMVEQLEGVEKGAGVQYLDWLAKARAALELGVEGFIARDADGLPELMARALQDDELRSLLTSVGVPELLAPHHSRMARRFRDPRLRALFTFQDLYVGLTPYNAPGVYSLLAATELTDGVWYPLGGFGQIRDALLRVGQSLGVRLRCGARVAGIRTAPGEAGGQVVTGVTLTSGEELEADVVVSNRDVPLTYELLRGPAEAHGSATARRLLAQDYSAGVISYNWSVDRKLDQLLHHNVFLSGDFEGSWVRATGPDTLSRSPNFYVHCPGRTDPTACPPGSDSVMVLLPVANIQEVVKAQEAERRRGVPLGSLSGLASASPSALSSLSQSSSVSSTAAVDYSSLVAAGREAVLRSMAEAGIADVRQHIVDELVIDPMEWRDRYSLAHGAAFGLSHGLTQLSVFRPPLADKQVRGLYLVGASTRPGNGVPLTMISADLVVGRVMQDVAAGVI